MIHRRSQWILEIAALILVGLTLWPAPGSALRNLKTVRPDDPRVRDLVPLAERIKEAVIKRDIRVIQELQIGWGEDDDLDNPNSSLYCYLFDTTCMRKRSDPRIPIRSVRDILVGAKPLRISIQEYRVLGPPGEKPKTRFRVIFYDAAKVRLPIRIEGRTSCRDIDCVTWTFERVGSEWRSPVGVFDTRGAEA